CSAPLPALLSFPPRLSSDLQYIVLLIRNANNEYIIEQRPQTGLLADLWQFPMIPVDEIQLDEIEDWIDKNYGVKMEIAISLQERSEEHTSELQSRFDIVCRL